jgi:hypothetical protein
MHLKPETGGDAIPGVLGKNGGNSREKRVCLPLWENPIFQPPLSHSKAAEAVRWATGDGTQPKSCSRRTVMALV